MTERKTGATAEQVEAAAERRYNFLMTGYPNHTHMTGMGKTWDIDAKRIRLVSSFEVHARYLIDPDHRIVSVADLRALVSLAVAGDESTAALDRITALIGDGA